MSHVFEVRANWEGGLSGHGQLTSPALEIPFSASKSLKGAGIGANPEELLLGAAAACFLITLGTVFSLRKIPIGKLSIQSEIEVATENGLSVRRIRHVPSVEDSPASDAEIHSCVRRAEEFCLISKALKGNVEVAVQYPVKSYRSKVDEVSGVCAEGSIESNLRGD